MSSRRWDKEELERAFSEPCLAEARDCPFCQGTTLSIVSEGRPPIGLKKWRVFCTTCLSHGPWHRSPEAAVGFWNGEHVRLGQMPADDPDIVSG